MGGRIAIIIFTFLPFWATSQCDTLGGGLIELQMTTREEGLLYGTDGHCVEAAVVNGGLEMVGGTLSVVDGDTVGQVLRWTGTDWVPRLIIFPDAVSGDTSYNGITYIPGTPNAHKLGGTLTENTTVNGVNTRTLTLNNMLRISMESERTSGTGYTTLQLGSTNIEGFDVFHINPSDPNQQGYLRVNYTTGNVFRLQNATNVQTEVSQYWDGASHVTDISATDGGLNNKVLRVTKSGIFGLMLDKVDAISEPGIVMWDTLTGEFRYQSPDILLAGPSEPANQVVYGTGTGIDSDTTLKYINRGMLFKDTAGTTTPKVWAWYKDATNTFRMFEMFPRNQTNYPYNTKFGMYGSNYPNANHSGASPGNHVFEIGFNIGRDEASLSSLRNKYETHYWGELLNGVRSRNYEWIVEQTDTLNRIHRPIQIQAAHNGSAGDVGFESDGFYLSEYESRTQYLKYNRYDQQWYFNDTISLLFNKPQKNTPLLSFRSNDNSRLWPMFQSDASDNLVINKDGNNIYTYASRLVFNTLGEISTADGNAIKIGASARPGKLLITGNTSDLFILDRSGEQWGTYVNTDNIAYTRHNGNPYFQAYETDGAKIVIGNNNVGIGDASGLNLQSRFSLLQKSNAAEGGIALINTSSAQSYLQTNASGAFSLCVGSSTERFVVTSSGAAGIGTSSPAQKLHVEGTARITGSDGAATTITGRDAENDITNVTVSTGLQFSSGVLSISPIPANQVVFGSGTGLNSDTTLKYFPTTRILQLNDKTINHSIFTKRKPWGGAYSNIISTIWRNAVQLGDSAGARVTNRLAFNVDASSLPEIISSTGEIRFDSTILSINGSHPSGLQIGMTTPSTADVLYQGFDGNALFWSKNNSGQPLYFHKNAPSYSLYMNSAGKIGINNNGPGVGTLDVIQRSDDFLGGIGLRSTGNNYGVFFRDNSNNMYLTENASTRYMWGTGGVFQAYGRVDAGEATHTSNNGIVFPLRITSASNVYNIGAYGLNPEGNVTAGRGDMVTNVATGDLYQKRTTSGNTGWGKILNLSDANGAATDSVLMWNGTAWAPGQVGSTSIANSGVTAGTYGEEGAPFEIDVAADGRITGAAAIAYTSATYTSGTTTWQPLDKVVFADPTSGNVIIEMNGAMHEFVPYILAGGSNLTNNIKIRVTGGGEVFKISGDYGTTTSDYTLTAGQHLTITRVGTTYIVNKN